MSNIDVLMEEKRTVLKETNHDKKRVDELNEQIHVACEDREWNTLVKVLGSLETDHGSTNNTNVWKEMKKAFPKKVKPVPTGVQNIEGKVITNPKEKKGVILNHFMHRMRKRPVKEELEEVLNLNDDTFRLRIEMAKKKKSTPITLEELNRSLKSLKIGKSRDPQSLLSELFKDGVIGTDLKNSLLMMFNKVKDEIYLPECFRTAQITMIHKKKCKLDLNNWRGIFVTSVLRTILMKILHERIYHQVESGMTDSQIGSLKNKSVRNHLFVVNSVISDVLSSAKKPPIDLNVMDYKQMFDAEDLHINLNALFEAGIQDDILALIYEANKENVISVKTPNGTTHTGTIHNKIMQGDVLGPLLSSNMVDKNIGEVAIRKSICYMYKDKVPIPPLAMVDDTLGISVCGVETTKMNSFLNTRTNVMNLQFGCDKCEKIHIGRKQYTDICPTLTIDSWEEKLVEGSDGNKYIEDTFSGKKIMKEVEEKKYLGDIISKNGNTKSNIKERTNRAMGTVNKII